LTATLNYKQGKVDGPRSFKDKVVLRTITVAGSLVAYVSYKARMYVGLGCAMDELCSSVVV
jgi:hypothetical protein